MRVSTRVWASSFSASPPSSLRRTRAAPLGPVLRARGAAPLLGHHPGHGRLARGLPPLPLLLRRLPLLDQREVVLEREVDLRARGLGGAQGGGEEEQEQGEGP